jgi:glutathione synthase
MMKLLFIADPLEDLKIEKDTTLAMMLAGQKASHAIYFGKAQSLHSTGAQVQILAQRLEINLTQSPWYKIVSESVEDLVNFDAILMRQDPPFSVEYLTNTWLLSQAERVGARVFNSPTALREHSEKVAILEFAKWITPTLITRSLAQIKDFHQLYQDIVIKPLDGMGGMGIFRVGPDGTNLASIVETLGQNGERSLMAQRYLSEIKDGDKRLLLINGKPVPFVLARIPQKGDIRGNLAAGGIGQARPLGPTEIAIANELGPELVRRGLFLVGVDIIGSHLTEINVTSPTCFVEITQQTGFDVAKFWLEELEIQIMRG